MYLGMKGLHRGLRGLSLLALLLPAAGLHAQTADSLPRSPQLRSLPSIGSSAEDRVRVRQLLGETSTDGFLVRSPSSVDLARPAGAARWWLIAPEVELAYNSDIPFSLNDGAMWAGRGLTTQVTGGGRISAGPVTLVLAPQVVYTENQGFGTIPQDTLGGSVYFPPWYLAQPSADLPIRFGDQPMVQVLPGQSSLTLDAGPVAVGAATENQWWGPGIRNAIVMSNHAEGVPHLFLRTAAPVRTRLGTLEGKWIVGGLSESLYFDTVSTNDIRSLSGFAATFRPARAPDLTVGLSRVVYGGVEDGGAVLGRAFDVFGRWEGPRVVEDTDPEATTGAGGAAEPARTKVESPEYDQILSVFARWIFPKDGLEVYGEWARLELPSSPLNLLNEPNHSQGYTLGLQWAEEVRKSSLFRVQTEMTYLEESASFNNRPAPLYYVSEAVPQGYTHRGQTVGAAIGPGASSQWIAGDFLARNWQVGAFAGRIRWENDVYYRHFSQFVEVGHDVSVFGGIRGGFSALGATLTAEITREVRYNYLFQGPFANPWGHGATDINNTRVRLTVSPAR